VEPGYRPYHDPPEPPPFIFYNTFNAGSYIRRKSAEELIRCFCRTFGPEDGANLVLRTQRNDEIYALCREYDRFGLVVVEDMEALGVGEFARRYSNVHCVVHPSKGEGFGLIPFQAIACERPVIAPAATGMADFLNDSNALPVRTAGRIRGIGQGNQVGYYYSIDEKHLCELMREVYDNWPKHYKRAREVGPLFREKHQWNRTLSGLVRVLQTLAGRGERAKDPTALIQGLVADVHAGTA
jgi:glycosyltransferase involved in cell wall biosynthesis